MFIPPLEQVNIDDILKVRIFAVTSLMLNTSEGLDNAAVL